MCFFPHKKDFTLIYGHFSCLIIVLFGPIFMEEFVLFSNACQILELMRCNLNLPKLDILTWLSSDYRARALKLSEHLKKGQNMFYFYFANSNFNVIFPNFLFKIFDDSALVLGVASENTQTIAPSWFHWKLNFYEKFIFYPLF